MSFHRALLPWARCVVTYKSCQLQEYSLLHSFSENAAQLMDFGFLFLQIILCGLKKETNKKKRLNKLSLYPHQMPPHFKLFFWVPLISANRFSLLFLFPSLLSFLPLLEVYPPSTTAPLYNSYPVPSRQGHTHTLLHCNFTVFFICLDTQISIIVLQFATIFSRHAVQVCS